MCAYGNGLFIYNEIKKWNKYNGTSLSASIVAGLFSIVNQVRLNNNAQYLSLSNLYNLFEFNNDLSLFFNDVTSGSVTDNRNNVNYNAVAGFDVGSGFGVPIIRQFCMYFSGKECPGYRRDPM